MQGHWKTWHASQAGLSLLHLICNRESPTVSFTHSQQGTNMRTFPELASIEHTSTYLALPAGLAVHRFARLVAHAPSWEPLDSHLRSRDCDWMNSRHRMVCVIRIGRFIHGYAHCQGFFVKLDVKLAESGREARSSRTRTRTRSNSSAQRSFKRVQRRGAPRETMRERSAGDEE